MESSGHETQALFGILSNYRDDKIEPVKTRRARTVFSKKVFKRAAQQISFNIDTEGAPEVTAKVHEVLETWTKGKPLSSWISNCLPLHLNLPLKTSPTEYFMLQSLIFGEGLPPVLLTLYTEDAVDKNPERSKDELKLEMREFCMTCARMLTFSLLNFCHREFLLLPCTLALDADFTAETLQNEIDKQLDDARYYYGGPSVLGKITYDELVRAVSIAATTTSAPCFLCDEDWLQAMDRDWDGAMRHLMKKMLQGSPVSVTYTTNTEIKTKSATLEAAKRMSYYHKMVVVTANEDVHRTVKRLSEAAQEEHGFHSDWFRSVDSAEHISGADRVIAIDVEDFTNLQNVNVTISKQHATLERGELFRVLLIGKSGSGKSSTANTLLGEHLFENSASFAQVTKKNQIKRNTYVGREIEVVDSPGIFDITRDNGMDGNTLTSGQGSDRELGFDVVCYVMKIERFTEEDDKVFGLLRDILGNDVLQHMIIVFTHGDSIEQGENISSILAQAPERLKNIIEQCQNRYVVFDNTKQRNRAQVENFFEMVTTINQSHCGKRLSYICPDAAMINSRWQRARMEDIQRRHLQLNTYRKG